MAKVKTVSQSTAIIEVPVAEPDHGTYIARERGHLDLHLRGEAVDAFRRVHAGCVAAGVKLANGKPVATKSEVIQHLFESISAGSGSGNQQTV